MAKPPSATFGGGIPVEDVAGQTLAPPIMGSPVQPNTGHNEPGMDKGTERRPMQVTFGATKQDMDASNDELMPPIMHSHGPRLVEPNTNPGKGQMIRQEQATFGDAKAVMVDNDSITGADGDGNDDAASGARYIGNGRNDG